ncbi:MAG: hypothetical protein J2P30_15445 [Actinobacteria bacterium]|nr:hypothetical protein [Actinomycetota bacterium]
MNRNDHRSPGTMQAVRHAARAVADVVRECNYATSRLRELRLFPDIRAANGDCAPDTYADFLWRSSVAVWHEPSARRRAAGARTRR